MRPSTLGALALGLVGLLAGCNTQNAEPPPSQAKTPASDERPAEPRRSTELPPGHPPIGQVATITGRIALAPGLAEKLSPEAVLFIIARRPGQRAPVAVVRLQGVTFPLLYTVGPQNAMVPSGRFEGEVEVSARLDIDGLIGPPQPGDLEGRYLKNPVSVGQQDVDITLTRID